MWPISTAGDELAMPGHVVVLGDPVALVAEPLDVPRQVERVAQRIGRGRANGDGRQVEDGERNRRGRHRGSAGSTVAGRRARGADLAAVRGSRRKAIARVDAPTHGGEVEQDQQADDQDQGFHERRTNQWVEFARATASGQARPGLGRSGGRRRAGPGQRVSGAATATGGVRGSCRKAVARVDAPAHRGKVEYDQQADDQNQGFHGRGTYQWRS